MKAERLKPVVWLVACKFHALKLPCVCNDFITPRQTAGESNYIKPHKAVNEECSDGCVIPEQDLCLAWNQWFVSGTNCLRRLSLISSLETTFSSFVVANYQTSSR